MKIYILNYVTHYTKGVIIIVIIISINLPDNHTVAVAEDTLQAADMAQAKVAAHTDLEVVKQMGNQELIEYSHLTLILKVEKIAFSSSL